MYESFNIVNNMNGGFMKILITGAASGIAFLTGITLKSRGHDVIMTTHTVEQLTTLNEKLQLLKLDITTFKLDINNKKDIKLLSDFEFDVLINHAGIGLGGSIIDINESEVENNFKTNFFSSYNLAKYFCNRLIKEKRKGKLIITSSIAGVVPIEFLGSYCSSKAAITMMARCLKKEVKLLSQDIDICVIEPGAYHTGFNQVMIDSINIPSNSPFFDQESRIKNRLKFKFKLMEKKRINSIVSQIILAVEENNPRFIYSAPLLQTIFKKLYLLLFY